MGPIEPYEVERVNDANRSIQSLGRGGRGGVETPGPLELTRIPDVIVPECVSKCANGVSVMACVSACMEMDDGRIQTGDGKSKPGIPQRVNLATVPGSRDGAYEVHGAFRAQSARTRLRNNAPRWIRAGRVDGENVNGESCVNLERTGPHAGACVKLHMLHAACSVRGTRRAGSRDDTLGRACMGNHAGSVRGRRHWGPRARVTGERRALARNADRSKASADCDAQGDDKTPGIVRWKGRTSKSQTAALAVQKKKKGPHSKYTAPARMW